MKVQNIVFNRLGNNISILIEYQDKNIQILDQICFNINDFSFEVSSICFDENTPLNIVMNAVSNSKRFNIQFLFTQKELLIEPLGVFIPEENGFKGKVKNTEIFFKAGMNPDIQRLLTGNHLFLPQDNFFKTVAYLVT